MEKSSEKEKIKKDKENKKQINFEKFKKTNLLALVCYLGFFCLIPILVKEKDDFVKFHAKQGLALFIVEMVTCMVFGIVPIFWLFGGFFMLFWLILNIIGITNVLNEEKKKLPVIGRFADKLNI